MIALLLWHLFWNKLSTNDGYYYQVDTLNFHDEGKIIRVYNDHCLLSIWRKIFEQKIRCDEDTAIIILQCNKQRKDYRLACDSLVRTPMEIISVHGLYYYQQLFLIHGGVYQINPTGLKNLYHSYTPPYISNPFGNHQVFGRNGRIYVRVYHGKYWTYYRNRFLNPSEHPFAWFRIKKDTAVLEGFWGRYPYKFLRKKLTLNYGLRFVWCDLWVDTLCLPERIYVKFWYDDTIVEYDPFGKELRRYWAPQSYRILGVDSCYIYGKYQSDEGTYLWIHSKSDGRFVGALPYFKHWRYVGIIPKEGILYFADKRLHYRVYKVRIVGLKYGDCGCR